MAKKTKKKKPAKRMKVAEYRQIVIRLPPDLLVWIDGTAASLGYSRERMIREALYGLKHGMQLAVHDKDGTLFSQVREHVAESVATAMREAVNEVMKSAR